MEDAVRLRQLVASLESGTSDAVKESTEYLRSLHGRGEEAHSRLCAAVLRGWGEGSGGQEGCGELLHLMGPAEALAVVCDSIGETSLPAARWLCGEVHQISFSQLLYSQCRLPKTSRLTPNGERLVGAICRLPDVIANRMGHHVDPILLPQPYFTAISQAVLSCLEQIHQSLRASDDCFLVFPAAVIGKAAILGHKAAIFSTLVPSLEQRVIGNPLWRQVTHSLFSSIPTNCLEPVLDGLLLHTSPSLQPPVALYSMLGELAVTNKKAGFLLTHKLFLVKVPPSPLAVFTLIGYLSASDALRKLMGKSLQSALGVWSDASALRHMDNRQHTWITQLVILGMTCLRDGELESLKPVLQKLVMAGIQVHIDSPIEAIRHVGMATGESLMNRLNPSTTHKLKFEYVPTEEVKTLLNLARPVAEQDAELKLSLKKNPPKEKDCPPPPQPAVRYGEGMVQTTECSDSDSDDDLVPYAMGEDPSSSQPTPPRYLRTLQQALLSNSDPLEQEAALSTAESLIRSKPHDLNEVCVELAKVLLHLSDTFALSEFTELRHKALVALAVTCPSTVAPYLTTEFYAPNYNLRQRMDILEVLSSAATELSNPASVTMVTTNTLRASSSKPWEDVIKERLKAKTRVISKGPSKAPPTATPSQFAPVASLFFFPLMARFDSPLNTLDLLGQDSLVLGNLLYTLGTIMYCATHAPVATTMAKALMNFIWTFRYHPSAYVRQGVLYALGMAVVSTPVHCFLTEMEGALTEAGHWAKDVCVNDADDQSRALARHVLTLMDSALNEL